MGSGVNDTAVTAGAAVRPPGSERSEDLRQPWRPRPPAGQNRGGGTPSPFRGTPAWIPGALY